MDTAAEESPLGANQPAPAQRNAVATDLLSGAGLGLLLGLIVGLAISPVVGVVVGGLVSLLAVFLGLDSRADANPAVLARVQINGVRIGAFGLAAVAGVLLGQYVRINNPMAETPERQLARWRAAFPDNPALAAQMMIKERTGITPGALSFHRDAPPTTVKAASGPVPIQPGLFGGESGKDLCGDLAPDRFGDDVQKILEAYAVEGGPYAAAARRIGELPPAHRLSSLSAAHALLCELQAAQRKQKGPPP